VAGPLDKWQLRITLNDFLILILKQLLPWHEHVSLSPRFQNSTVLWVLTPLLCILNRCVLFLSWWGGNCCGEEALIAEGVLDGYFVYLLEGALFLVWSWVFYWVWARLHVAEETTVVVGGLVLLWWRWEALLSLASSSNWPSLLLVLRRHFQWIRSLVCFASLTFGLNLISLLQDEISSLTDIVFYYFSQIARLRLRHNSRWLVLARTANPFDLLVSGARRSFWILLRWLVHGLI